MDVKPLLLIDSVGFGMTHFVQECVA